MNSLVQVCVEKPPSNLCDLVYEKTNLYFSIDTDVDRMRF